MKVAAIIQARMGSSRLPGKVLLNLAGEPMLGRVVSRVRRTRLIAEVLVATTVESRDDALVEFCHSRGIACCRGSETDVLDRFIRAARIANADAVVRITADCPLIDSEVIDKVVTHFLRRQPMVDYVSNVIPVRTYPRGLDTEVVSREALERAHRKATDAPSREHVTAFICRHPELFRLEVCQAEQDYSQHRWTVDTPEDFALVEKIYAHFSHDAFTWREALELIARHPEWTRLNEHIEQKPLTASA
jgi:spore coat polysaccharide biosynthesis protein SpsF